ncbi:MAG: NAD(P)/FAD-dependent oxidoreductase [Microcoleaceae cyanobacterium MO_207.B10]|nr:NAD(P)/FAD-dependent oxidoreductase [Microcoleaceae cyanobacterium MO_207.B10]
MSTEHFDIAIVGAGLSGIAAAYYLQLKCPSKNYIILEGRDSMGGTWDFFRYPGIRSDSDMYSFGYSFKPWPNPKTIADGPSILKYIQETASENGIDKHIRYSLLVKKATWSSDRAVWTVETECKKTAETLVFSCNFLLMCSGYYSYKEGYTPKFKGLSTVLK